MSQENELEFELEVPKAAAEISREAVTANIEKNMQKVESGEEYKSITQTLDKNITNQLDVKVEEITRELLSTDSDSAEFKDITDSLNKLGDKEIMKTTNLSNRMLSRSSIKSMKNNEYGGGDNVAKELSKLRRKITDLDPGQRKGIFTKNKILGLIPFGVGRKVDDYFQEYKSAEGQIEDIVKALTNGKDQLLEDNAYIDEDREQMQKMMQSLEQYQYVIARLDKKIESMLPGIEAEDKIKAEDIKQEILFPIRQKRLDILQHLAVSMQGYMALQVIKKNNKELIRGVDRATTTTIAALRTAITVSEALGAQKLVLDQINAVNDITNNLILQSSEALGAQGQEIHRQATDSSIQVATLEKAFQNIFKAMDDMDKFRSMALPNMKKTIDSMEATVSKAKDYMTSQRANRIGNFTEELARETAEDNKPSRDRVVKIR